MKIVPAILALLATAICSFAGVAIDDEAFGKSLGGWKKGNYADYPLSGADYRTYKPETSPTPDGGLFISVRVDHLRGWLSTNDHAVLEVSVNAKGAITSAQSTIAIQGKSISSDVIIGANEAGKALLGPDKAIQIGTDLVSDLSAKLLRENIVEAGRVSFPAVVRHNYNRLFQAIKVGDAVTPPANPASGDATTPVPPPPAPPGPPVSPTSPPVGVKNYGGDTAPALPIPPQAPEAKPEPDKAPAPPAEPPKL